MVTHRHAAIGPFRDSLQGSVIATVSILRIDVTLNVILTVPTAGSNVTFPSESPFPPSPPSISRVTSVTDNVTLVDEPRHPPVGNVTLPLATSSSAGPDPVSGRPRAG